MRKLFGLAALASLLAALAFSQGIWVNSSLGGPATISFALQADPPSSMMRYRSGSASRVSNGAGGAESVAHRYFYNELDQTYFGYDVCLETDPQTGSSHVTFYDLSIGVLDIVPYAVRGDPTVWKKLPIPALPASRAIQAGDTIRLDVWSDPAAGQKLGDIIRFDQRPQMLRQQFSVVAGAPMRVGGPGDPRPIPTVSGDARDYSAEDSEMRLTQVRVTMNGEIVDIMRPSNATGTLVWFYIPSHGRYILSLAPRPELGFVKTGEVRGGAITFTSGKDKFLLESPIQIAPGSAPYFLYVLHDADWAPIAKNQADRMQFGSVNPRELVLLQKK